MVKIIVAEVKRVGLFGFNVRYNNRPQSNESKPSAAVSAAISSSTR